MTPSQDGNAALLAQGPHLSPDLDLARIHVELITGEPDTPMCWRLLRGREDAGINLDGDVATVWPEIIDRQREGWQAYVIPNAGGHTDAEITETRCLFIDADGIPLPAAWHVEPDFLVIRDNTHWHAYWRLARRRVGFTDQPALSPTEFKTAQRRLAAFYGSDPTVCNPSRVMRVAGSLHCKLPPKGDGKVRLVTIEDHNPGGTPHGADELLSGLPEVATVASVRKAIGDLQEDKPEAVRQAKFYLANRAAPVEFAGSDDACYKVAAKLYRDLKLSFDTVLDMMSEWSGFDEDWLAEKIEHAAAHGQNDRGSDVPTSNQEAFGAAVAKLAAAGLLPPASNDDTAPANDDDLAPNPYALHKPSEYRNKPPGAFYDADKMLPHEQRGAVGVVYGKSGHHKTNTLLTMLMQAALDHPATRVLYVAGEGVDGFGRDRVWAHAASRGLSQGWIDTHLAIVENVPPLTNLDEVQKLVTAAKAFGPTIIVIDTLSTGTPGVDENAKAMSDILSGNGAAGGLRKHFNALVIAVSHSGKDESRGLRGHSGQYANADFVLHVEKKGLGIEVTSEKMRDGAREGAQAFYRVEPIGVPVPVRISEGEHRDLKADHEHDMEPASLRRIRWVLRQTGAYGRARGFATAYLAHQMALHLHREAEAGSAELVEAEKEWKKTLENAHGSKWRDEVASSVIDLHGRQPTLKWHLPEDAVQSDPLDDLESQG